MDAEREQEGEAVLRLRAGDVAARRFDEETVILDLRSSRYLAANPSASVLWRALEQGATRTQLVEALLREFEVTRERAEADVDNFIGDVRRRELLADE
jgi:hypothetical protein